MKRILLLFAALLWAGCGNSNFDGVVTGTGGGNPTTVVQGRVQLDQPFANATVTFRTFEGQSIPTVAPVVTEADGTFTAELQTLPTHFVATATGVPIAGGPQETFESEYDGIDPATEQVVINPLTSLVVAYHDKNPQLTYKQADQQVRDNLRIPKNHTTRNNLVNGGHRPGFSVSNFLADARSKASLGQVRALTTVSYTEVDPISVDDSGRGWATAGAQLGVAVISDALSATDVISGDQLFSWTANLLNTNDYPAIAQLLEEISQELVDVYNDLSAEITESTFTNSVASLNNELGSITATSTLLQQYQNNGDASEQEIQNLIDGAVETSYLGLLDTISSAQLGTSSATGLQAELIALQDLSDTTFISNETFYNPLVTEFNYYANLETQLINTILEGFHGQSPPQAQTAQNWYDTYARDVQTQQTLVPLPLESDDVILHRASGLVFFATEQSPATYTTAKSKAATFAEGGYTGWRVATYADLYVMLYNQEPGSASTKSFEKPNLSLQDLEDAGFTLVEHSTPSTFNGDDDWYVGAEYSAYEPGVKKVQGQLDYGASAGVYSLDVGDQAPLNQMVGYWKSVTSSKLPYFLVCDSATQTPAQIGALGRLQSLIVSESTSTPRLEAMGTYLVFQLVEGLYSPVYNSFVDLSDTVAWESSNPFVLRVQNVPASTEDITTLSTTPDITVAAGVYTWLAAGSAKVTATLFDPWSANITEVSANISLSKSASDYTAPTLQSLQITPSSLILTATGDTEIFATGFYSDGSAKLLTSGITWVSSIPEAHVTSASGEYFLVLSSIPSGVNSFTLTATSGSTTGTTTVTIVQ
jgi:hypothetical protein